MYKAIVIIFSISFSSTLFAQTIGTNTKPIDEKRYEKISGNPYFYKEWQEASIHGKQGNQLDKIEVNYNGYTNQFEAKVEGGFVELEGTVYPKIEIAADNSHFQYAVHPRLMNQYVQVLFEGQKNNLINSFVASISTRKVQNVGSTIIKESFAIKKTYYLLNKDELQLIKLKKKDILSAFPQKEVATLVKKEKLKLNCAEDLIKVLEVVESL